MNVQYDDVVDALYIELSGESPEATTEVSDGLNVDTTPTGRIAGIEILDASSRIDLPQKDQNMAMITQLPLRPILDLFRQNHTEALSLVATCGCCPRGRPGMDYDEEADVLYINFQRPSGPGRDTAPRSSLLGHASEADHSELDVMRAFAGASRPLNSDTIRRYQGDRMVGFTILNASQRE